MTFRSNNPGFDPYAELIEGPRRGGFDDVPEVLKEDYHDRRAKGLVVDADLPKPVTPEEQLRDLIRHSEGLSDADKSALETTAVNSLGTIVKRPTETFQPKSAFNHVNRQ